MFHSELSSSPRRQRAKVCRPSSRAARISLSTVTRIEKPHHVALIIVLVDVLEVRIERVVVEIEIGVGVGGALPGIGDGEILSIEDLRLGMAAIFGIGDGKRPVVAVVADGADEFFLGHDLEHADADCR